MHAPTTGSRGSIPGPIPFLARTCRRIAAAAGQLLAILAIVAAAGCAETAKAPEKKEFMFWPPMPDQPHVQFLRSISSTGDVTAVQEKFDELIYGKEKTSDLPFARPYGLRFYDGKIYICDATAANVSILDLRKKEVRILGRSGIVTLMKPLDIAVSSDGYKYIADTAHGAVMVFGPNDVYLTKIMYQKMRPVSVAVRDNELYVADMTASMVRVFDRNTGQQLRTIGEPGGGGEGKIGGAMGVALDPQGNVFINDVVGCRVQKFTRDGKFISSLGGQGTFPGRFVRPKHMTIDGSGILYVVDNAFANVQMFNEKGQMLMFFGGPGRHPGAMDMPTGVCVAETDLDLFAPYVHPAFQLQRVIITSNNYGAQKVNIYALGELKPGKTLSDIANSRVPGIVGFAPQTTTQPSQLGTPSDLAPTTAPATSPATAPATTGPATRKENTGSSVSTPAVDSKR